MSRRRAYALRLIFVESLTGLVRELCGLLLIVLRLGCITLLLVDAGEREVEVGGGGLELELLLEEGGCAFEVAGLGAGLRAEDRCLRADLVRNGMCCGEIGYFLVTIALREHVDEAIESGKIGLVVSE